MSDKKSWKRFQKLAVFKQQMALEGSMVNPTPGAVCMSGDKGENPPNPDTPQEEPTATAGETEGNLVNAFMVPDPEYPVAQVVPPPPNSAPPEVAADEEAAPNRKRVLVWLVGIALVIVVVVVAVVVAGTQNGSDEGQPSSSNSIAASPESSLTDPPAHGETFGGTSDPTTTTQDSVPETDVPSQARVPSQAPSFPPSTAPSPAPTEAPSRGPSTAPSPAPSMFPSFEPTGVPSVIPTKESSTTSSVPEAPSRCPSTAPGETFGGTSDPTQDSVPEPDVPSEPPSQFGVPSQAPSFPPSTAPSPAPTEAPSHGPSTGPSPAPSILPSFKPTGLPSVIPTSEPSTAPSVPVVYAPPFGPTTLLPTVSSAIDSSMFVNWNPIGELEADVVDGNSYFGWSVSLSADATVLAVSRPYGGLGFPIFTFKYDDSGSWTPLGGDVFAADGSPARSSFFGWSIHLSGDGTTLAVGAPHSAHNINTATEGSVHVFRWNEESADWVRKGDPILGPIRLDEFGKSVSISHDGSTLVVGAPLNDFNGESAGLVRLYYFNGVKWERVGSSILGAGEGANFGMNVALSADGRTFAAVATYPINDYGNWDPLGPEAYAQAYRYKDDNGTSTWELLGRELSLGNEFSTSSTIPLALSADGETLAWGKTTKIQEGDQILYGRVVVNKYDPSNKQWNVIGSPITGSSTSGYYGYSLALSQDGTTLVFGSTEDSAHVFLFEDGQGWKQQGPTIEGVTGGSFAASIAMSADGTIVAVANPVYGAGFTPRTGRVLVFQAEQEVFK